MKDKDVYQGLSEDFLEKGRATNLQSHNQIFATKSKQIEIEGWFKQSKNIDLKKQQKINKNRKNQFKRNNSLDERLEQIYKKYYCDNNLSYCKNLLKIDQENENSIQKLKDKLKHLVPRNEHPEGRSVEFKQIGSRRQSEQLNRQKKIMSNMYNYNEDKVYKNPQIEEKVLFEKSKYNEKFQLFLKMKQKIRKKNNVVVHEIKDKCVKSPWDISKKEQIQRHYAITQAVREKNKIRIKFKNRETEKKQKNVELVSNLMSGFKVKSVEFNKVLNQQELERKKQQYHSSITQRPSKSIPAIKKMNNTALNSFRL